MAGLVSVDKGGDMEMVEDKCDTQRSLRDMIRIRARWLRDIEKMKSEGTWNSSAISLIYV